MAREKIPGDPVSVLSPREYEVFGLLASGKTNREIAEQLSISVKTVDTHRGHTLKRLGVRNNSDLARLAIKHFVIDINGLVFTPEQRAAAFAQARLIEELLAAHAARAAQAA